MNDNSLECAICGQEFKNETKVNDIIQHMAITHQLGPKDLFIASIISALTSSSFHTQPETEAPSQ